MRFGSSSRSRWAWRLGTGAAVWLVTVTAMSQAGMGPRLLPTAALVLALATLAGLAADLHANGASAPWPMAMYETTPPTEDPRVRQLARNIEGATSREGRSTSVRLTLSAIVDERVRARHGIERDSAPERFASLVGHDLLSWLDPSADAPPISRRELSAVLTTIEKL